jgi:hypothetical protein
MVQPEGRKRNSHQNKTPEEKTGHHRMDGSTRRRGGKRRRTLDRDGYAFLFLLFPSIKTNCAPQTWLIIGIWVIWAGTLFKLISTGPVEARLKVLTRGTSFFP